MDTSWMDLSLATTWKDRCASQQSSKCQDPAMPALWAPDWLIDTEQNCLVRGDASMKYVALSYRWGASVWSREGLDKLDELRKPGGLSNSFIAKKPIIRDAIHVVQNINERYLWADAVCIIYDHKAHLAEQLQHMGAIYASAKLTIVATDGDGMTGIPGLQGCSVPRKVDGIFPWTDNREIFVRDLPGLNRIFSPEYFRRAWTMQEYILSPRRLIIGNQQIHWTCGCGTWHEDLPHKCSPVNQSSESVVLATKFLRRRPDFIALDCLFRSYNYLDTTYPEDALPAISGLLKLISPSFARGFLFGLPIMCFEASLLWGSKFWYLNAVDVVYKGLERRQYSGRSILPDAELPSWTWLGWNSDYLSFMQDEEDFQVTPYSVLTSPDLPRAEKWITLPTTQWYSQDTPTSSTRRRIRSSWFKPYNDDLLDARDLPAGWTVGLYPAAYGPGAPTVRSVPFGLTGRYVYQHPEFPNCLFWRPFPVSADREFRPMRQAKFLSCKTKRGFFRCVRQTGCAAEAGGMDYHLQLFDNDNNPCGWVQLPRADAALPSLSREASPSSDASFSGNSVSQTHEVVELVLVCHRLYSVSFNQQRLQWLDRRSYRPFCGVLCVEWVNGVAYRKGYGYVTRRAWDQHNVEGINLVLG
ncbi:uncharacterized protein TRIVIDRAFT_191263 [Trichoderma virens Gv29-8]|uniref:Heterokaryon incompatibility domain-containing protein n=1 Tax=Hypocrea virens (strain Gv29-8 / FGSC 10586) TaxID=413071 RepID=G9MQX1_HYPVG|nr:uncharacterized protein TRIVIDRAFT_191263 [Trichoderma virens Gv29-8]EHK22500.1 hypothetical protein TRIVIDRAFT_191263 [Trichoderma virens Gv29-8]